MRRFLCYLSCLFILGGEVDGEVVLFDDFENNDNEWPLEGNGTKFKMKKGVYEIDRTKRDSPYLLLYDGLDFSGEFTIECKMRKTKGNNDSVWYGLVWGYQTDGDYCDFLVGADGTYSLNIKEVTEYNEIVKWTDHPALGKKDKFNVLRIERKAATLNFMGKEMKNMDQFNYYFYINDQLIKSYDNWPNVYGRQLAFRMSSKVKIEVDYLKVTVP